MIHPLIDGWDLTRGSDARVPLVSPIFPVAAVSAPQACEAVDDFDAHDVFRLFVTQLPLDP